MFVAICLLIGLFLQAQAKLPYFLKKYDVSAWKKPKNLQIRGGASTVLISQVQDTFRSSRSKFESVHMMGEFVDIVFEGGSKYRFHAEWLRDACRDENYVKNAAGERLLHKIQFVVGVSADIKVNAAEVRSDGVLEISFDNGEVCTFAAEMLQAYATRCAKHLSGPPTKRADIDWLMPFNGVPDAKGPNPESITLWKGVNGAEIPVMQWDRAMTPEGNLEMLKHLFGGCGAIRIRGVSEPGVPALHHLIDYAFGGLQKDPSRQESNWLIARKEDASSVSYNPATRLNNHSDQSLPNHGIPGVFLVMHYAEGWGANTIVDSFAAAEDLRKEDPGAFELLSTYGNDQERDLLASRQDAKQGHTSSLCLTSAAPIIQLDTDGRIKRVQYNEVFRTPLSVPFDKFKSWYAAYMKFGRMLESSQYERELPMETGDFMIVNNWRVLHGRAGARDGTDIGKISKNRVLVGGTITRENAFSRARALLQQVEGTRLYGPHGFSVA